MRRSLLPLAIAGCGLVPASAQELVGNGSFEDHSACPDYLSQIDRAIGWSRPTEGTSDYLHSCAIDPFVAVPNNEFGDQPAHTGEAYGGFYAFSGCEPATQTADGYREYVMRELEQPMVVGQVYQVTFYVNLGEVSGYGVNDLGAHFSMEPPHRLDDQWLQRTPQVHHGGVSWLDDLDEWMPVSGCFVADSAYRWITIGNFNGPTASPFIAVPPVATVYSYYFVDDVSVTPGQGVSLAEDTVKACAPIELAVVDPQPTVQYEWSTGETGPAIVVDSTGMYRVSLPNGACSSTDSTYVRIGRPVNLEMATDTVVDMCLTPVVRLGPDSLPMNAQVQWSTGSTLPWVDVIDPGTYTITVGGPDLCEASAAITLVDACAHPVYVPNAFTPNGDGINDVWQPVWRSNPDATVTVEVYDRWGRALFSAADARSGWDGLADGSPVPSGVYAYRLHAHDAGAALTDTRSGHVVLVR